MYLSLSYSGLLLLHDDSFKVLYFSVFISKSLDLLILLSSLTDMLLSVGTNVSIRKYVFLL